ncbi:hypothetical protein [Pedobacter sp. CFBP9032]|uniref:hypothetical protein n=1 Tax=Pedobacter sp. CFBP9032 TaxID=3096539 RepID=UPI002A6B05DB|nr:hypothetical protein [Pedobacter sp. CFBP9032]MDY0905468.1 hypothetical protein [Pedobacter sp. CFBP9032]
MGFKKMFFLVLFVCLITVWQYYGDQDEKKPAETVLEKNNICFTGRIISYNRSTDRAYGVIKFTVITSNKGNFNISDPKWLYPYRLEKGYGEFYGYIPLGITAGQLVRLNAGEKSVKLYNGNAEFAKTSVFVTSERNFIEYVNEHTSFNR